MRLQLIRNATLRLTYGGHQFVIDPCLAPRGSLPSFADIAPNPTVDLPLPIADILADMDALIVSHLHSDHFDAAARAALPKTVPLFCQPGNEAAIREAGFTDVRPIDESIVWHGITLTRTAGQHGTGETAQLMGPVSGFVLRAAGEPTVYWAGDTIWYPEVARIIAAERPDVIVTHSSGATWKGSPPIVMDADGTIAVCRAAPAARVIATHLEAFDHGTVTRDGLRRAADAHGVGREQLVIPADGETITL